jgi:integrase
LITTKKVQQEKEEFVRDFLLIALYTGARANELLFTYTKNIFLNDNYFIGGLKTKAGINREIPIHPDIKHLFEKYYNSENKFLFMQPNGNKADYDYYFYHYKHNFKDLHPFISLHTAHHARHTLRNELRKLNVQKVIINSIIGHSNGNVGEDVYTHISVEEKLEAIKKVTYKKHDDSLL